MHHSPKFQQNPISGASDVGWDSHTNEVTLIYSAIFIVRAKNIQQVTMINPERLCEFIFSLGSPAHNSHFLFPYETAWFNSYSFLIITTRNLDKNLPVMWSFWLSVSHCGLHHHLCDVQFQGLCKIWQRKACMHGWNLCLFMKIY